MLVFDNLSFGFNPGHDIFMNLNHSFEKNLIHSVIGPSGCGKTTLLYLAAGLLHPGDGSVTTGGEAAVKGREKTAFILQDHGLFPWKTVHENLTLPLRIRKIPSQERICAAQRILKETGLEGKEHHYPETLSGGEKQRLAVGRALIQEPDLLLLDEPFSSLDAMTREKLQDYLKQLQEKRPRTMILVTHSIEEAVFLSDRIHIMNHRGMLSSLYNNPAVPEARKSHVYFEQCRKLRERLEEGLSE